MRQATLRTRELPKQIFVRLFGLSVVIHLLGILCYVLIACSLGWDISYISMGWSRSGLILATMIPISISGLGLRETAALLLLGAFGADEAVAFALLVFGITVLFFGSLGGIVEAWRLWLSPGEN